MRLAMRAAALNYRDLLVPAKGYGSRMKALPLIMCSDGVGVVDRLGAGVSRPAVGSRVCPLFFQSWQDGEPDDAKLAHSLGCELDGTMVDYMVLPAAGVALVPEHLSDAEAATLPTAGVTAWRALITEGRLRPGARVLVQGTGGVSLFALLFARLAGAFVVVTSSSDEKLERARALGADAVINYRTTADWGKRARELAGGGLDHVVGWAARPPCRSRCAPCAPAAPSASSACWPVDRWMPASTPIVTRHVRLQGITVGNRDDFRAMAQVIGGAG
ncbi:MAG: NAD(P)-dependent alcohol dehydrogenase [Rhodospirillales bacterium]